MKMDNTISMEKWDNSRMVLTTMITVGFLVFVIAYLLNKHGYPEYPCVALRFIGCTLYISTIGGVLLQVLSEEEK